MKNKLLALLLSLSVLSSAHASSTPAAAAGRTMNVVAVFGLCEIGTYSAPNAFNERFQRICNRVYGYYRAAYSININLTKSSDNYVVRSCADTCVMENENYNTFCEHTDFCAAHCTMYTNVFNNIFPLPRPAVNGVELYITSARMCASAGSVHGDLYGAAFTNHNCLLVRDDDYVYENHIDYQDYGIYYVSKTLIHEIGHFYGVIDHYNIDDEDRNNCIWGLNRNNSTVREQLLVCNECRNIILSNANRYNHS